jgi:hypothetical protein
MRKKILFSGRSTRKRETNIDMILVLLTGNFMFLQYMLEVRVRGYGI